MNFKKNIIISIISIFGLGFLAHNMYEWFPNKFTSIFFPVNESIYEHQKMIFTSIMFYGIIEYFLLRKTKYNNLPLALVTSALVTMALVVSIFTPVYYLLDKKDNLFVTLGIYLFAIIMGQIVSYYILKNKTNYKKLNIVSLISIPVIFTILAILTYYPPKNELFYDKTEQKYGIYTYYD